MLPQAQTVYYFMVSKCKFKRCNICQNYWVSKSKFTYTGTGKTYNVRSKLCCTDSNFIYLIHCKLSREKYVGSAFKNNFKPRSRIRKIDVITGKKRYGVVKYFLTKCIHGNKFENIEVQLIEQV